MGIRAIGAMRRARLMIGGRILALAVQLTLARDAAAQPATDQPTLQIDQRCESAFGFALGLRWLPKRPAYMYATSSSDVKVRENQKGFTASLSTRWIKSRPTQKTVRHFEHHPS